MSDKRFTLMGYGETAVWPTVKSLDTKDAARVLRAASQMLEEDPTFDRVEVWSDGRCIHAVRRPHLI